MRLSRPFAAVLLAGAVLLILGRAFAFVYTDYVWYAGLGARRLWIEGSVDAALLQLLTFVPAFAFAFANLSAVRHSILSLVLPRRLANVEFAEAVPPRRLDRAAVVLALLIAAVAATAVPHWTALALVRTGVRFGETDPYHQLDMGYYTAWLPLEIGLHGWAWIVVLVTTLVVAGLYALTPGLRWQAGTVHMTAYVRRHLAVLVAVILLMLAWRARIASITLLYEGSGPDAAFTYVDHRWLLPGYVVLSLGTAAAGALFLWSAWGRQISLMFGALTGVLLLWLAVYQLLPLFARASAPDADSAAALDAPYAATRRAFTERAYDLTEAGTPAERQRPGIDLTRTQAVARATSLAHVAPGARGYLILGGGRGVTAPGTGGILSRMAHAWVEQDTRLLSRELPRGARVLRVRDLDERVRRLAPIFAQGSRPAALFRADTLYWVTDLYSSSVTYPLSRRYTVAGERRGYFRHAGTAYTHGSTGTVTIVTVATPDPIARAWRNRFPELLQPAGAAPAWVDELALEPAPAIPPAREAVDAAFREQVRELYLRMRAALSRSDLAAFGAAFDSLGRLLGRGEPGPATR